MADKVGVGGSACRPRPQQSCSRLWLKTVHCTVFQTRRPTHSYQETSNLGVFLYLLSPPCKTRFCVLPCNTIRVAPPLTHFANFQFALKGGVGGSAYRPRPQQSCFRLWLKTAHCTVFQTHRPTH